MSPQTPAYTIRLATSSDIPTIQTIEHNAAKKFLSIPALSDIATAVVMPTSKLDTWLSTGRIYLATPTDSSRPIGLIAALPMDASLHVAEVSVEPEHNRRGVGGMLLGKVFEWAAEAGGTGRVSLMTYREVPWNKAWYEGRGFREVDAREVGEKHVQKMTTDEEERGLVRPGFTRCCMLWEVQGRDNV